jgi:hypothetical protein
LLVGSGAFMNSHRERIVALAACHALPASYGAASVSWTSSRPARKELMLDV